MCADVMYFNNIELFTSIALYLKFCLGQILINIKFKNLLGAIQNVARPYKCQFFAIISMLTDKTFASLVVDLKGL